jgi:3-hydroxybutyryl-CoA dehydrogenase
MGHQIALQCATHNYDVHLVDATKEILDSTQEKIGKVLEERVSRGEISSDSMEKVLSKISYTTDLEKAAIDADFVIEAVYEYVEVKRNVFSQLDCICPSHTILARAHSTGCGEP